MGVGHFGEVSCRERQQGQLADVCVGGGTDGVGDARGLSRGAACERLERHQPRNDRLDELDCAWSWHGSVVLDCWWSGQQHPMRSDVMGLRHVIALPCWCWIAGQSSGVSNSGGCCWQLVTRPVRWHVSNQRGAAKQHGWDWLSQPDTAGSKDGAHVCERWRKVWRVCLRRHRSMGVGHGSAM